MISGRKEYSRTSRYGHLSNTDSSLLRTVSNVPRNSHIFSFKKTSIIPILSNTDNGHEISAPESNFIKNLTSLLRILLWSGADPESRSGESAQGESRFWPSFTIQHFIAFTCREWKANSLGRYGTNSSVSKTCFVTAMFAPYVYKANYPKSLPFPLKEL